MYVRDVVLGVNDGLVSMFLLQTGSWNAGLTNRQTLLFGVCGEAVFRLAEFLAAPRPHVVVGTLHLFNSCS